MRQGTTRTSWRVAVLAAVALFLAVSATAVAGTAAAADGDQAFGVTAGADAQPPVDADGSSTILLEEHGAVEFPTSGTATLTLPSGSDVRLDVEASDPAASASGASDVTVANATVVDDGTVRVRVEGASDGAVESIRLEGLRFVVPPDAATTTATWRFGDAAASVRLEPERLAGEIDAEPLPRGLDGAPDESTVLIDATDGRTDGFHAEGERMAIYIPEAERDRLSFDTRSQPEVELLGEGCSSETDSVTRVLPPTRDRGHTEDVFFFEVDCDVDADNAVAVSGLRFNTTGAGVAEPAEFEAPLVVEAVPVNATGLVAVETADVLSVVAPAVSGGADRVEVPADATGVTGDAPARVTVTDDAGGLMADGSEVVVSLRGDGVTFDRSQSFAVETDGVDATVSEVRATAVVLTVDGDSEAGDSVRLAGAGGDGLAFNVSADATSARLAVTTSAGDDPVTQAAGTTVAVGDGEDDGGPGDGDGGSVGDGGGGGEPADGGAGGSDDGGDGDDGSVDGGDGDGESDDGGDGDGESDDGGDGDGESAGEGDGAGGTDDGEDGGEDTGSARGGSGGDGGSTGGGSSAGDGGSSAGDGDSTDRRPAGERRALEDADPGREGVTVEFESVPVSAITFSETTDGEVAVVPLETLPGGVPSPPGRTVTAVDIDVPDALADATATLRFTVDASALGAAGAEGATLYHYDAESGSWDPLETEAVESADGVVTFEATTRGFSPFALQTTGEEGTATGTPDPTPTGTTRDGGGTDAAEAASIGGDPLVLLVLGLVAVTTVGIVARRFR